VKVEHSLLAGSNLVKAVYEHPVVLSSMPDKCTVQYRARLLSGPAGRPSKANEVLSPTSAPIKYEASLRLFTFAATGADKGVYKFEFSVYFKERDVITLGPPDLDEMELSIFKLKEKVFDGPTYEKPPSSFIALDRQRTSVGWSYTLPDYTIKTPGYDATVAAIVTFPGLTKTFLEFDPESNSIKLKEDLKNLDPKIIKGTHKFSVKLRLKNEDGTIPEETNVD